ncbi:uncharacterized protein N7482_003973 [Penicillium canariense]|uniref:Homeobox and C2H2 transcription factor n=1 Tax=Penicillium canariense TaxID=189055 RepID=A0A9W9I7Z7_9EURO|nr:uncharacterized protein N7482_003973 [Penicillium canariense]KAJ5168379.1 hypothetical protein N7482_003973 [Penicillium canariense]
MDRQPPFDSSSPRQLPESLPDSALQNIVDNDVPGGWLPDDPIVDWNTMADFYFCASGPTNLERPQCTGLDSSQGLSSPSEGNNTNPDTWYSSESVQLPQVGSFRSAIPSPNLGNISQWLDGAYRPSTPCSHCRRHRLQCLIIRTTSANPNPIASCSSCVALFRECSLAKGEKRVASGFETFTPVLGHLHGLPEDAETGTGEARKESKQFVRKGARVLREWFYQHQEFPYPDDDEKRQLSSETGFSLKRISTWFANARRRQKQKIQSANLLSATRSRVGSPLVTSTLSSLTPMERWQASPPEDESVSESVIQDAITSGTVESDHPIDPFQLDESTMDLFHFDEASSHLASSISSFGSRASETSDSISSAWSHQSGREGGMPFPLLSQTKKPRHRGHSRRQSNVEEHQYQCTFCTHSFKKRNDWSRHEKSVHLQLDSWVCTPNLIELEQQWSAHLAECCFCDTPLPLAAHLEEHEFHICAQKPESERSFSRKDYLWQHLRKFHACTKPPIPSLGAWCGTGANAQSRCGFCDITLPTWAVRAQHLGEHFKNGARMDQWEGDWGLDPTTMGVLRNAVLPSQRAVAGRSS